MKMMMMMKMINKFIFYIVIDNTISDFYLAFNRDNNQEES